jgi:aryl-alcohol dehydrogenase-like predicted oxidoreductase
LDENLGALEVKLTTEDLAKINEALLAITIQGDRYSKALTALANR